MRTKFFLHRVWARTALRLGYPVSSSQLPRPPYSRRRTPMRLSHVLLACDTNAAYLNFWPLVRRAWEEIVHLDVVLVLVAEEDEAAETQLDGSVVRFTPLPGIHTTFQAQCIRLLFPALVETPAAVLISDIDLLPVRPSYFHAPIAPLDDRAFVAYRDVLLPRDEVMIPYNAARPETWADVFGVTDLDDVRARLQEWAETIRYDGVRGGAGWYTDQRVLHERLFAWHERTGRAWVLDDDYCGYRRLPRWMLEQQGGVTPQQARDLAGRRYSDSDWVIPFAEHEELNRKLLALAIEHAR